MSKVNRVFSLEAYGRSVPDFRYLVLLPENTSDDLNTIQTAWSYAIRYTAKGLDLPDHDAALKLLQERHPSWVIIPGACQPVAINLAKADDDVPEGQR